MIAQRLTQNPAMDLNAPLALLGGLTPAAFMRRHWQKKPLLVRQALPGVQPPLARAALFALAGQDEVESRLVVRRADGGWTLRRGPLARRALPPLRQRQWTLLVQGLDLHHAAAHQMLRRFGFIPQARLDDLMLSWASDGGGVGPHVDAYDVFLLQVQGARRWRIGPANDVSFVEGLPLKILRRFEPVDEWLLEPGDMLYLPPGWGHDGAAVGESMTASIGFRAASRGELAAELLARLADSDSPSAPQRRYRDASQPATTAPGLVPSALQDFARAAVQDALRRPGAVERVLGEWLSEPKAEVWFERGAAASGHGALRLDAGSRLLYDAQHLYLNGESFRCSGADARALHQLADTGRLAASGRARLSTAARALTDEWISAGWLHEETP